MSTVLGEELFIHQTGIYNQLSGPDFFNAQISIGNQLWAGNVELHIKSLDWYAHKHEIDTAYENVILHVVWLFNGDVKRKDGSIIPTLELSKYIDESLLVQYQNLFQGKYKRFIPCEKEVGLVDSFKKSNWIDRLYIERLEKKSTQINEILNHVNKNWEQVLFILLMKSFGTKINGDLFLEIALKFDFSIIQKLGDDVKAIESFLFGMTGLLDDAEMEDQYYLELKQKFEFLALKYRIDKPVVSKPEFFKLRPANFPTIRLSQLANLYAKNNRLFNSCINESRTDYGTVFNVSASSYWENHYRFGKIAPTVKKKISKPFIDLLLLNTIIPLRFCFEQHKGNENYETIYDIVEVLKPENNAIVKKYNEIGWESRSAKESQALLQLHTHFCSKGKCLECAIGTHLMNLKS